MGFIDVNLVNSEPIQVESVAVGGFGTDPSGRLRVGQMYTLLDGKILNADNTRLFETIGTGTGAFSNNKFSMSVTSGQYLIRQSKRFNPYFSGKAQLIEETFDNFQPQVGITKRVGYFSSNAVAPYNSNKDGIWIESDGTTIRLICSRDGTETLNVPITEWTGYDNLAEYKTLTTWKNFSVSAMDFLWLGGAEQRLYMKTSNGFTLAHAFEYAGTAEDVFIKSPNQPVRYEIRSTSGSGSMRYICCQVATEGSYDEAGETISVSNITHVNAASVGTIYAVLGVRKATTYRDIAIQIVDMAISNTSPQNDAGVLYLLLNPTLSAPLSYSAYSRFERAIATTQTVTTSGADITCDRIIAALPVGAAGSTNVMSSNFLSYMTGLIGNTYDQYVLAYLPITANQSVYGVITLKEY